MPSFEQDMNELYAFSGEIKFNMPKELEERKQVRVHEVTGQSETSSLFGEK